MDKLTQLLDEVELGMESVKAAEERLPDFLNTEEGIRHTIYQILSRLQAIEDKLGI